MNYHACCNIHSYTQQVLVDPGFGEDVRLQPPPSPPFPPSPPRRKHTSHVEILPPSPRKGARARHSSEPPTGGVCVCVGGGGGGGG